MIWIFYSLKSGEFGSFFSLKTPFLKSGNHIIQVEKYLVTFRQKKEKEELLLLRVLFFIRVLQYPWQN
jgi:hypothetical protein